MAKAKQKTEDDDLMGTASNHGKPGHNSGEVSGDRLKSFVERIERLEEEKKTIGDDIKDVYGEAKGRGYDTKAMKKIVAMRKKDANERYEEETVLDTYLAALGMAPLGGSLED